jgi:hypothetical protein
VETVVKLANRIGSDLQNVSSIPDQNTLARFVIMTRLIRTMNCTQLNEVTKKLFTPQPSFWTQPSASASTRLSTW